MKLNMKRVLAMLLAALLVLSAFAGCSGNNGGNESQGDGTDPKEYINMDSMLPIIKEDYDLTMTCASVVRGGFTQKPEDHYIWKFWKEYGNLTINPTYYDEGAWGEQRTLLFASNKLPDFFLFCAWGTGDLLNYGQDQGLFMDLLPYIDEYCPNIKAAKDGKYATVFQQCVCPDGKLYSIPNINAEWAATTGVATQFIREDWLAAVGKEMPQTTDELYDVLKAFKAGDPNGDGDSTNDIPFIATQSNTTGEFSQTYLLSAFGINSDTTWEPYVASEGKIDVGFNHTNYIHFLEYTNKLFSEGLISSDLYTMTSELKNAMIQGNMVGVCQMYNPYSLYGVEKGQYDVVSVMPPLTSEYNKTKIWPLNETSFTVGGFIVSYQCEYPEAAMRMFDVWYAHDDNGTPMSLLFWVGPGKGGNWDSGYYIEEMKDTVGVQYNYDEAQSSWVGTYPGGLDVWTYINNRLLPSTNCVTGLMYYESELGDLCGAPQVLADYEMDWRNGVKDNLIPYEQLEMPVLFVTIEDQKRLSEIAQPIVEYIRTAQAEYVTGIKPITEDNLKADRDYVNSIGLEEYISILQRNYESFLANK